MKVRIISDKMIALSGDDNFENDIAIKLHGVNYPALVYTLEITRNTIDINLITRYLFNKNTGELDKEIKSDNPSDGIISDQLYIVEYCDIIYLSRSRDAAVNHLKEIIGKYHFSTNKFFEISVNEGEISFKCDFINQESKIFYTTRKCLFKTDNKSRYSCVIPSNKIVF